MSEVSDRIMDVRRKIEDALRRSGRPSSSVTLVAVSKLMPAEVIIDTIKAGHYCFGENYLQEALEKFAHVRDQLQRLVELSNVPSISLHFIGPLQSNKIKRAVGNFAVLETVASEKALSLVSDEAIKKGIVQQVFIQVNVSGEESKSGCAPSETELLITTAQSLAGVVVQGLMAIGTPPDNTSDSVNRSEFVRLRNLRDEVQQRCGVLIHELS